MPSPNNQARKLRRLALMATATELRLVRCDGNREDLANYQTGKYHAGWDTKVTPTVGDLLVSTVGAGRGRVIVSVCRAEEVTATETLWDPITDVPLLPPIAWTSLAAGSRPWNELKGAAARAFLDRLQHLILHPDYPSNTEGERRTSQCRARSAPNREQKLLSSQGICGACGTNYVERFGELGYRALEIHHRIPVSTQTPDPIKTSQRDLIALCGSCHNLVHGYSDPQAGLEAVTAVWAEYKSATAPTRN